MNALLVAMGGGHLLNIEDALSNALPRRVYQGVNLMGWRTAVGDGICNAPGEAPAGPADIRKADYPAYSELRANIRRRHIMAHIISYKLVRNANALRYRHTARFKFRLPYMPNTANSGENGQTIEGGLMVFDGPDTRLDLGAAFQWRLSPYAPAEYGMIYFWSGNAWIPTNTVLPVDTRWHTARFIIDYRAQTAEMSIDGLPYPTQFSMTEKDPGWGSTTDARLQTEAVSLFLCEGQGNRVRHRAQFKSWLWDWRP